MQFLVRKRRQAPPIIIISLIDILIVLLIFLMVSTTFRQQPALKLALPESKQGTAGASTDAPLVVTVSKQEPYFYLATRAVTLDKLKQELAASAAKNPQIVVAIRADTDSPLGKIVNVMDAAKEAGVKSSVNLFTKKAGP